ncbi:unnamed protein product [Prorocentrum cordatum]|uniref:Secreted protein n=1 Tax=Prorocentrum cordatum TaxID=2364126 RepID=A0ABN9PHU6_9DINO|nr:unnamed protein product [Polarella glacialis]
MKKTTSMTTSLMILVCQSAAKDLSSTAIHIVMHDSGGIVMNEIILAGGGQSAHAHTRNCWQVCGARCGMTCSWRPMLLIKSTRSARDEVVDIRSIITMVRW